MTLRETATNGVAMADVLEAPDELTCRRLLALLTGGDHDDG